MKRIDLDTLNIVSQVELVAKILTDLMFACRSDSAEMTLTFRRNCKSRRTGERLLGVRIDFGRCDSFLVRDDGPAWRGFILNGTASVFSLLHHLMLRVT